MYKRQEFVRSFSSRTYHKIAFPFPGPSGFETSEQWAANNCVEPTDNKFFRVAAETELERQAPRTIDPQRYWLFDHWSTGSDPAIHVAELSAGRVYGKSGAVISTENNLLTDMCQEQGNAPENHSLLKFESLPTPQRIDANIGVLSAAAANTYYHFIFDVIPRIQFLKERSLDYFFVNNRSGFQKQLLELAGIPKSKVIPATKYAHIQAKQLVATSMLSRPGTVSRTSWQYLRSLLNLRDTNSSFPRKIYISRHDARYRRVTNETQVVSALAQLGYQPIKLSKLTVSQQMQLFATAKRVVAPHGAGLSNLAFSLPETRVLELFSPHYVNPCYWTMCQHGGLVYYYLMGSAPRATQFESPKMHRKHITIEIEKLLASVEHMEAGP